MHVSTQFIVLRKEIKERRDGFPFIAFQFGDKTGEISGVMWDNVEDAIKFVKENEIVMVNGVVNTYGGRLQLSISSIKRARKYEIEDFIKNTERDIEKLFEELMRFRYSVKNTYLSQLLSKFFQDEQFVQAFKKAPAAVRIHHNYLGGLLEHTLDVVKACDSITRVYTFINRDLLITGAILHDVGKIKSYRYDRAIDHSTEGRLVGHIVFGWEMVNEKIDIIPEFPKELRLLLSHIILAHHGRLEWGSPVIPQTLEALVLHHIDNLDAYIKRFRDAEKERKANTKWSQYQKSLERFIYLGKIDS